MLRVLLKCTSVVVMRERQVLLSHFPHWSIVRHGFSGYTLKLSATDRVGRSESTGIQTNILLDLVVSENLLTIRNIKNKVSLILPY